MPRSIDSAGSWKPTVRTAGGFATDSSATSPTTGSGTACASGSTVRPAMRSRASPTIRPSMPTRSPSTSRPPAITVGRSATPSSPPSVPNARTPSRPRSHTSSARSEPAADCPRSNARTRRTAGAARLRPRPSRACWSRHSTRSAPAVRWSKIQSVVGRSVCSARRCVSGPATTHRRSARPRRCGRRSKPTAGRVPSVCVPGVPPSVPSSGSGRSACRRRCNAAAEAATEAEASTRRARSPRP